MRVSRTNSSGLPVNQTFKQSSSTEHTISVLFSIFKKNKHIDGPFSLYIISKEKDRENINLLRLYGSI